jgi:PBSX family phage terminase large subunit
MSLPLPLAPKQIEFTINAFAQWNIAHGSVRSGKTVGTIYAFLHACEACPDSLIYMVGHTSDTAYRNVIRYILESPQCAIFRPFCTWSPGKRQLKYRDKTIQVLGAKDEGAIGAFYGLTMSLVYCDEITLYPESIIDMIDTRLSNPWSKAIATCNPSYPTHKIKQWIDKAEAGDQNYYSLHYTLDDNPFLEESYKQRIRDSLSGLFFKRNYLGLWCMAEGAIFECFDKKIHVCSKPPAPAEYWICGIDYGTTNAFCGLLIGVSTGRQNQQGKRLWVEREFYWDCKKTNRQKTPSEFANDVYTFLEPYALKGIYIDPSAVFFKLELERKGMHVIAADNDVYNGIQSMTSEMAKGNLYVCDCCPNLIREIEGYVWDPKKSLQGEDEPLKKADHAVDALRYAIHTHKVPTYKPYGDDHDDTYLRTRFQPTPRKF